MKEKIALLGAGIVGVSSALELINRGYQVTLIDQDDPASHTSYGNAGVIAESSCIPLNQPGLMRELPGLLKNSGPAMRYNPQFMLKNLPWFLQFLSFCRPSFYKTTVDHLHSLISLSIATHRQWGKEAGVGEIIRDGKGWIYGYRDASSFDKGAESRKIFDQYAIPYQPLSPQDLKDLEPDIKDAFQRGLLLPSGLNIRNPQKLVHAYFKLFLKKGGVFHKQKIRGFVRLDDHFAVTFEDHAQNFDHLVIALGPWSGSFLKDHGIKIPLLWERGYHHHLIPKDGYALNRPVFDVDRGYVMAPMEQGLRITSGVELTHRDAPRNEAQIKAAMRAAEDIFPIAGKCDEESWLGCRPTLPDSCPMIGPSPDMKGLFYAFGHQHIGLNTGPGSAILLADMIEGKPPSQPIQAFRPDRF